MTLAHPISEADVNADGPLLQTVHSNRSCLFLSITDLSLPVRCRLGQERTIHGVNCIARERSLHIPSR